MKKTVWLLSGSHNNVLLLCGGSYWAALKVKLKCSLSFKPKSEIYVSEGTRSKEDFNRQVSN